MPEVLEAIGVAKPAFAAIGAFLGVVAFVPYIRDILRRKTKPHPYTWGIWALTQAIATAAAWYGNGGFGIAALLVGTTLVSLIFLMSLRYGTPDIRGIDAIVLAIALGALLIWWLLKQPLLTVVIISAVDLLGFGPTLRKSHRDPWSESLWIWVLFSVANVFSMLALAEYNALTLTYLLTMTIANLSLVVLCLIQRRVVPRSKELLSAK